MRISTVDWSLQDEGKVLAYFSLVIGDGNLELVIHDFRLIHRENSSPLVAFPSRPKFFHCVVCRQKCNINHNFCASCGAKLQKIEENDKLFHDIVHPIDNNTRHYFSRVILKAYNEQVECRK